ncbi:mannose-1-phosphate guanylyltransferase/mannose-6-phosphate isomerase [Sulfurospirillum diekertiae]|uniref:mannose-1-phosphate guanylyltransferase n=1 Tax=Sulfurospirillum diekertiae TaxID=1854492 RepID=A0A1Y0HN46_9BACT|nr:mannose-1-phosphate guanylyltransferase/mannose-6-phosphate isomerase [Sulfurospirillum diekertiae]ARU49528.1 Alginate biosynthesis protein AlgA [Sulfurospirillum diekertiae]ASC94331.1 Alginate biosynthesis protein AlgA [Sulfurospirillum diekertiae]
MVNLILCGGSGTRLWPISRTLMPKQFIRLFDGQSLFQLTVKRNKQLCSKQLIVSNIEQYFLALDQLNEVGGVTEAYYLLEPTARNTAPAIALACMALDAEEIVLVTPSDHLIKNHEAYKHVVERAKKLAQQDSLVTFGITPAFAETGFGYIEADGENVKAFHEKPNLHMAETYVQAGNYFWNSGMFCFKAGVFLEELHQYSPAIYDACKLAFERKLTTNDLEFRIALKDMQAIPEDSIDYAVMEKSKKVKVVTAGDIEWNDVGSFDALYQEFPKDDDGNTLYKRYINVDSKNNLIVPSCRAIATVDIEDLIIVDTPDALLISKKGSSQKVKRVVAELKNRQTEIHNIHLTAHRPWGTYTVLEDTPGYKIKRIVVNPGKRLSLQKHFHRSEHWIVVSGTATVTVGEETRLIRPNESTYIKMGEVHRLINDGKIPIVLIEAQVGEYTGEDDIVRIEDEYNRI